MTTLQTINASASPEVQMNSNLEAVSPAGLFGRKASTSAGLTFGYYGGILPGTFAAIADGTKTLTDAATNYIEADSAGLVYTNTSAFTAGRTRLYTAVTAGGVVTAYTDYRTALGMAVSSFTSPDITTSITTPSTTFAVFNTNATTVNAFGAASVALNIGHASAAAAFAGGISIPTGKAITGSGTATIDGFNIGSVAPGPLAGTTLTTNGQTNLNSADNAVTLNVKGVNGKFRMIGWETARATASIAAWTVTDTALKKLTLDGLGIDLTVTGTTPALSLAPTTGAVTTAAHKAGTTTRAAGDCYLLVDANGNFHVSAVGPAS